MTATTTATPPPSDTAANSARRLCRRSARRLMSRRTLSVAASGRRDTLWPNPLGHRHLGVAPSQVAAIAFDATVAKRNEPRCFLGDRKVVGDQDDCLPLAIQLLESID